MKDSQDRRTFERFDIKVPARVDVVTDGQERRRFFCRIFNISAGGIFLDTTEEIPDHSDIEIEIILSFGESPDMPGAGQQAHITATGRVLRREASGLVVRFNDDFELAIANARSGETLPVSRSSDADKVDPDPDAGHPGRQTAMP